MPHLMIERQFPVDPANLLPALTPDNTPYWEALQRGELVAQTCAGCGRSRHPIAPVCPYCHATEWSWQAMSGRAVIHSWVRMHRSYLPAFADLLPYVVATVQLAEGPRMFGRITPTRREITIGMPVTLLIERWPDGRCVPLFQPEEDV